MSQVFDGSMFGPGQPCFGCGPDHPAGFHLKVERQGDEVITRMTPDDRYQSVPGIMHGGLVATLADELAAWACIVIAEKFGFTVSMEAKYQSPVRIGKDIEARARITKSTGRFLHVEVNVAQEGRACCTSEFRFVLLDRSGVDKLVGRELPEEWYRFAR
jgi:uncharacterized protein (TIGR00369 family)